MSYDQSYPLPQVFLVDGGGGPQPSAQPPSLIPCWAFPPARERTGSGRRGRGWMGVRPGVAVVVLMLFLLVFAALGFEAYEILDMKGKLENNTREVQLIRPAADRTQQLVSPQKQIGLPAPGSNGEERRERPAAHVIGRIETRDFHKTLRWEPRTGQAFTSGGVTYRTEDGALQVNESGLYHIYSRVELLFSACSPTSSFEHSVFVWRPGHSSPLTLMEAHRAGFCSKQPGHPWTAESYLGSAHKLKKYDRVLVNVSHPAFLSHSHYANFFGLYRI